MVVAVGSIVVGVLDLVDLLLGEEIEVGIRPKSRQNHRLVAT